MEVGQKIKLVRLHRGLTQKQLGDLLNLGDGGANRIAYSQEICDRCEALIRRQMLHYGYLVR
jgi:transcriptional regulator with XRE-family HTH domain